MLDMALEEWFDDVDEDMLSFKNKIHNWMKDAELERRATMKQRASIFQELKSRRNQ